MEKSNGQTTPGYLYCYIQVLEAPGREHKSTVLLEESKTFITLITFITFILLLARQM